MDANAFLEMYAARIVEYALGVTYLVAFIPFWRYVQGERARMRVPVHAPAPSLVDLAASWFAVPDRVHLHPGHSWARAEADGLVTVGLDDFAQKLVDPERVELPPVGATVMQGDLAFRLGAGGRSVGMLSPVDGTVVAVNSRAARGAGALADPYGSGWLFRVKPARLASNLKQLLAGAAARRWLEEAGEALVARLEPEMGRVVQDGGVPVHGLARELAGERWDDLARKHFLT